MSTPVENTLKLITSRLTGKREKDIAFLKKQIEYYRFDARVTDELMRMLKTLNVSAGSSAVPA